MSDLHYTKEHEWVRIEADGTAAVGITKHAQGRLGDVVFVDLPPVGKTVSAGDELAVVESVKAASEIYTPVSGTVTAVNETLVKDPSQVNSDPLGSGWMVRLTTTSDASEIDALMDEAAYLVYIKV